MLRCQDETPTPELRTFYTAKRIIIICVVRYNKQKFIVRKRGVAVDNILNTITAYREERKWSLYDLATHAELKTSTISTWYNNNAIPTIPSLVKICDAFQITLSEFFAKAEGSESVPVALTPQQMQIIEKWSILRPDQQEAVLNLLNTIPWFYMDSNRVAALLLLWRMFCTSFILRPPCHHRQRKDEETWKGDWLSTNRAPATRTWFAADCIPALRPCGAACDCVVLWSEGWLMYFDSYITGKRIQQLRKTKGLTQEQFAVKLNISDRHLGKIERGEALLL